MEPTADVIAAVGLPVMDGVRERNPIVADSGTSFGESRRDGLTQFRLRNMTIHFLATRSPHQSAFVCNSDRNFYEQN